MDDDLQLDSNPMNAPEEDSPVHNMRVTEMLLAEGSITPEIIELLEEELDFYEVVSLVFLIYDSVPLGIQSLKVAELAYKNERLQSQSRRLLSNWARSYGCQNSWKSTFLEALAIIQNYYVIEKMGFRKEDVIEHYLPGTVDISANVNLMRKVLYNMCEKLTVEEGMKLVSLAKEDLLKAHALTNSTYCLESDFLEVHILNWIDAKYITVDSPTSVSNIVKHLKVMEKYSVKDSLESVAKQYDRICAGLEEDDSYVAEHSRLVEGAGHRIKQKKDNDTGSILSENGKLEENNSLPLEEIKYEMNPKNIGLCVIINQVKFYRETNPDLKRFVSSRELDCRSGSDCDRDRLSEAFGSFGFTIKIWNDLNHIELLQCVDEVAKNMVKNTHSCFVLCILSHGIEGEVYGVNSISVPIVQIKNKLNGKDCPKLINKPKIFIIQACQGHYISDAVSSSDADSMVEEDGPTAGRICSPQADTLTCLSTVPGYVSFRHKREGSWYIQTLCDLLLRPTTSTEINFTNILVAVNRQINGKHAKVDKMYKTMQPAFESTLTKHLYLPVNPAARKKVEEWKNNGDDD